MSDSNQEKRLIAISDLLAQYSIGNFNNPDIELSDDLDEIDSIISGVNMLGQELESTTVSRDFFADIYNTVSNILLVTNKKCEIIDANKTAIELLGYSENELHDFVVSDLIDEEDRFFLKEKVKEMDLKFKCELKFITKNQVALPSSFNCSKLFTADGELKGYLIISEDLTEKKNKERDILKKITETQENERTRVADDLHDSLGQELASIRMMLASITYKMDEQDELKKNLESCTELLDSSLKNIREICFDLIPSALSSGELIIALKQMSRKIDEESDIKFDFDFESDNTELPKDKQVAVFRVFQEFVHNSIKHSKCDKISVEFVETESVFSMRISDNGVGFNDQENKVYKGRGLSTMRSRIEALGGKASLVSKLGKGTQINIKFKLN